MQPLGGCRDRAVDDPVTCKIRKDRIVVIAVGRGHKPPPALGLHVVLAHEAADHLGIDDLVSMAQLGANPAIAIDLELVAIRHHGSNDLGVICSARRGVLGAAGRGVIVGGGGQSEERASFGDGEAMGPVMTDVFTLLGRGALRNAPFKNSISSACRPTMRSSAAIFASYSRKRSAARASSSKVPASYLATQMRIRLRERS